MESGENPEHTRRLAECTDPLPPILVHRPTHQVIDGVHRVRAALSLGRTRIAAHCFDGSTEAAFVLTVHGNIAHGLPLSAADLAGDSALAWQELARALERRGRATVFRCDSLDEFPLDEPSEPT